MQFGDQLTVIQAGTAVGPSTHIKTWYADTGGSRAIQARMEAHIVHAILLLLFCRDLDASTRVDFIL